jgi:predicted N-acyltransferase
MTVTCAERAADLPATSWDALVGADDFFLSTPWLRVAERSAGVPMRYFLSWDGDELSGGLATALADGAAAWPLGRPDSVLSHATSEGLPGARELSARVQSGAALLPSLVCGGRHIGRNRILHRARSERSAFLPLVERAEELGRHLGAACISFLYVDDRDTCLRSVLAARGYASHVSSTYSWLEVPAGGFDGYLRMLTRHRRETVRAERRRMAAAGVSVAVEPLTARAIPRLAWLETQLFAKYGLSSWDPLESQRAFEAVRGELGEAALVSMARDGDEVRGFVLLMRWQDAWYAWRGGFDYEFQGRLPLYFETAYYRPVESAPAFGVRVIYYGVGSAATKRSRGCEDSLQHSCILWLKER